MSSDLMIAQTDNLVILDKWSGISTHSHLGDEVNGFVELMSDRLGYQKPLFVVHRLDKATSGVLVTAKTKEAAEEMRQLFSQHRVHKTYVFLTDRRSENSDYTVTSEISKKGNTWVSEKTHIHEGSPSQLPTHEPIPNLAVTQFVRRKRNYGFEMWEAKPLSGKTHQIRLHAQVLGLSILGDELYGGSYYPRLCLHAEKIEIPGHGQWISYLPFFMQRYGLSWDIDLVQALVGIDRRHREFGVNTKSCLRLVDRNSEKYRIDQWGSILTLSPQKELLQNEMQEQHNRWESLGRYLQKQIFIKTEGDQGAISMLPPPWVGLESSGLKFELRLDSGLQPGLFMDFRHLRKWILQQNFSNKQVLNLFCYTGSLSVAFAKAGAASVSSVDVSVNYLEWAKRNFSLNGLSVESHKFFKRDARDFLKKSQKSGPSYDCILIDPPSFSRPKGGDSFQVKKDLPEMVHESLQLLKPNGILIVASNFEQWTYENFLRDLSIPRSFQKLVLPPGESDFDFHAHLAAWIKK